MPVEIFSIIKLARFTGPLAEECGNAALFVGRACRHHHIGMKRRLILQQDIHTAVFLLEALYGYPSASFIPCRRISAMIVFGSTSKLPLEFTALIKSYAEQQCAYGYPYYNDFSLLLHAI